MLHIKIRIGCEKSTFNFKINYDFRMELLQTYPASSDGASSDTDDDGELAHCKLITLKNCRSVALASELAPVVGTKMDVGGTRCIDPQTKELSYNPKYEELFQPMVCYRFQIY